MRIAFFSTFSPGTCSERFSAAVLPYLSLNHEVLVFVDDQDYSEGRNLPFLTFPDREREAPFDLVIFQVEDHPALGQLLSALPLCSATVVMHDIGFDRLQSYLPEVTKLGVRDFVLKNSEHLFVKSLHMKSSLGSGEFIPSPTPLPALDVVDRSRSELRRVHPQEPFIIIYDGGTRSLNETISRTLKGCGEGIRSIVLPNRSEAGLPRLEYDSLVQGADLFIGFHFDILHDLPPGLAVAMAAGVPVIALEFGGSTELPPEVALRVRPGRTLPGELHRVVKLLQESSELRSELGSRGRRYAETVLDPALVAADLLGGASPRLSYLATQANERRRKVRVAREELLMSLRRELEEIPNDGMFGDG